MSVRERQQELLRGLARSAPRSLVRTAAYPAPRGRIGSVAVGGVPVIAPVAGAVGAGGGAGLLGALGERGGDTFGVAQNVLAGQVGVSVTAEIIGPLVVTHFWGTHTAGLAKAVGYGVKYSAESSATGGQSVTGVGILTDILNGTLYIDSQASAFHAYPMKLIALKRLFFKFIAQNGTAAAVEFQQAVSVVYV